MQPASVDAPGVEVVDEGLGGDGGLDAQPARVARGGGAGEEAFEGVCGRDEPAERGVHHVRRLLEHRERRLHVGAHARPRAAVANLWRDLARAQSMQGKEHTALQSLLRALTVVDGLPPDTSLQAAADVVERALQSGDPVTTEARMALIESTREAMDQLNETSP